jgi:hypothetical protein
MCDHIEELGPIAAAAGRTPLSRQTKSDRETGALF